jgi:gliding motility-associated-like protein
MTKLSLTIIFICIISSVIAQKNNSIAFLENKGQWEKQINYKACTKDGSVFLEDNKFTFVYFSLDDIANLHHNDLNDTENDCEKHEHSSCGHTHLDDNSVDIHYHAYKVNFVNSNLNTQLKGEEKRLDYYNFFIGNDETKWAGGVKSYNKIKYSNLYNNIDLVTYSNDKKFKYDFIINPGGDVNSIKLDYEGVESIQIINNDLVIQTSIKEIIELAPYAYQVINGKEIKVECYYKLEGTTLSFVLPSGYDKTQKLIIDPTIEGCTFAGTSGGSSTDTWGSTASYDDNGNIYIGARSFSAGYPTTVGAFQTSSLGANMFSQITTVGISKFSPDATSLIYSTYLGGTGKDTPHSLFVNSNGELYVFGTTNSSNFPCSSTAYDNTSNGLYDLFVTHFNDNGTGIIGSTYIGGNFDDGIGDMLSSSATNYGDEYRGEIIVDNIGNCYISSISQSSNFPTSSNAYQTSLGGNKDGVIFSLNNDLSTLNFSTYFGGTAFDVAFGIRLDANNNIYVSGATGNSFFTSTGYISTYQGGIKDAYVVKFSPDCSALLASSYFGTSGTDEAFFIDINKYGDIYIYGQNGGIITPTTGIYGNPNSRQFVAEFSPDLNTLIYQTVIGSGSSQGDFAPSAFMVDICDRVYIAGHRAVNSYGSGCPVTMTTGGFSSSGGVYLATLNPTGTGLMFGAYIRGADHVDGGTSRFDPNGFVYHAVCSCPGFSGDFPTTVGAYDNTNSTSNCEIGVFKIDFDALLVSSNFQTDTIDSLCVPATIDFINNSLNAITYFWDFDDGNTSTLANPTHTYTNPGLYNIMLIATNTNTCNIVDTTYYTFIAYNCGVRLNDTSMCYGDSVPIYIVSNSGTPPFTYAWSAGLPPTTGPHIVAPALTSNYIITVTDSTGTITTDTATVTVYPIPIITVLSDSICIGETAILLASGADTYVWNTYSPNNPLTISPSATTTYSVTGTDINGCIGTSTAEVLVSNKPNLNISGIAAHCDKSDGSANVVATGGSSGIYTYNWNTTPNTTTPSLTNIPSGTYTVTVEDNGCSETASINITNIPGPIADYWISPRVAEKEEMIQFTDVSIGAITWFWDFGDGQNAIGLDPTHSYDSSGVYDTWLYIEDDNECVDSISKRIIIKYLFTFYIPNTFSPNGDNVNDIFIPKGMNIDEDRFLMHLYDRWGNRIFETTNLYEGWDGKVNGQAIKRHDIMGAVFVYYIYLYEKGTNISHEYRGKVLLLR